MQPASVATAASASGPVPGTAAQYITCTLDDAEFGIDIMAVREIRGWTQPTAIPHAAAWMRGVTNLRGTIVPIVDLRARFGFGPTDPGAMHVVVIIQNGTRTAGLLVDAVSDIVTVDADRIRPVPEIGASAPERLLSGLVPLDRGMVSLVCLDTLLAFDEADSASLALAS